MSRSSNFYIEQLAYPRSATQGNRSAGRDLEIQPSEHSHSRSSGVPKVDVLKGEVTLDLFPNKQFALRRLRIDFWHGVNGLEHYGATLLGLGCVRHELENVSGLSCREISGDRAETMKVLGATHLNGREDN